MLLFCSSSAAAQTCDPLIPATTPTANFVINGNGTVTDKKTTLMWKRCPEGMLWSGTVCTGIPSLFQWQQALQRQGVVNAAGGFAGFADWRLPNIAELESIVERQCYDPDLNLIIFPVGSLNTLNPNFFYYFWSSSSYAADGSRVWNVSLVGGNDFYNWATDNRHAILVRGGQ